MSEDVEAGFVDLSTILSGGTAMGTRRIDLDQLSNADVLARLKAGLDGDKEAMRDIVIGVTPIIQIRVAKALLRRAHQARGRNIRSDVEDLVQEVFASLFAKNGQALRTWDPDRGLGFTRFVSFLAEREVGMIMRRRKRNPWTEDPTVDDRLNEISDSTTDQETRTESRQMLLLVADRLKERLSPQGRIYFQRLYLEEKTIQDVAKEHGTTPGALYTWRNRLLKLVRELEDQIAKEGQERD